MSDLSQWFVALLFPWGPRSLILLLQFGQNIPCLLLAGHQNRLRSSLWSALAISCSPNPIAASAVLIEPFAGVCPSIASSAKIQWEVGSLLVCVPSSGDPSLTSQTRPTPPAQTLLAGCLLGVIAPTVVWWFLIVQLFHYTWERNVHLHEALMDAHGPARHLSWYTASFSINIFWMNKWVSAIQQRAVQRPQSREQSFHSPHCVGFQPDCTTCSHLGLWENLVALHSVTTDGYFFLMFFLCRFDSKQAQVLNFQCWHCPFVWTNNQRKVALNLLNCSIPSFSLLHAIETLVSQEKPSCNDFWEFKQWTWNDMSGTSQ